jgi:hypothetical protein
LCLPHISHIRATSPNLTIFRDRIFTNVTKVKCGHRVRLYSSRTGVLIRGRNTHAEERGQMRGQPSANQEKVLARNQPWSLLDLHKLLLLKTLRLLYFVMGVLIVSYRCVDIYWLNSEIFRISWISMLCWFLMQFSPVKMQSYEFSPNFYA